MVMEVLPGNGLQSTLNGAITAAATSLTIQTGDAGSWPSSGQYRAVLCQDPVNGPFELVRITGGQGTATLTVVRGAESYNGSTTAYAWPSGSTISAVITNGGLAAYLGAGNFLPLTGGTLTGNLTVQGQLGVGAPVLSNTGMVVLTPSTQLAGATQYGALFAAITSSVATVMGAAVAAQSATQPASFTQAESTDFLALGPSWGSGSSITNAIGVHVNNQGGGQATNAYGVYIDAQSGSSQNVGLYNAGTTQLNSFLGIGIGPSSTTMVWLQGGSTLTGTQQSGLAVTTNFNSSATVSGASISVGFQTAAQVFTMTSGYGLQIQAALVQSGATVTTMYGIYVNNQTVSGVGTSYGVYIADQTGSTNNVGLWCLGQARFDRGIGMGTVPNPSVGFRMSSTLLISTSPNGYGFWVNPTFNSQTTATAAAIACSVITQAAGFTVTSGYALWVQTPVLGSGSAITTQYGVYVRNQGVSGIANAYGLYLENTSGASSTNISLYNAGSTQLSTAVGMGTAPISNQLVMASGMSIVQGTTGAANNSLDRTGIMGGTDPAYALRVNGAAWYAGNVSAGGFSTNGNFQTGGWMQGQYFVTDGDYRGGSVNVDRNGLGDGTVNQPWLHFAGGGEGLGSKRTSGGNQNGLDFYQGNTVRMQVNNQGNISIGAANPSPNQSSLYVNPTALGGLNQFGVQVVVNGTSAGTSGIIGVSAVMTTAAASYTVGTGYTFLAYGPSLGAGSSLTTQYGLYIANQGAAGITSAFGIYIAAQSGASSSNYGIYCVADVLIAAQSSGSHLNVLVRTGGNSAGDLGGYFIQANNGTPQFEMWSDSAQGTQRIKSAGTLALHAGNNGFTATNQWLTIASGGQITVNTQQTVSAGNVFNVYGATGSYSTLLVGYNGSGSYGLQVQAGTGSGDIAMVVYNRAASINIFYLRGDGYPYVNQAWAVGSTRDVKTNLTPLSNALATVRRMDGQRFNYVHDPAQAHHGFIAEDLDAILPDVVRRSAEGKIEGIAYTELIPIVVEAIKELAGRVDALDGRAA